MSEIPNHDCFGFIIDTNSYAGNFERDMCAHVAGVIGECGVGEEFIEEDINEKYHAELTMSVADDHGCHRPCYIYNSPNSRNYNSVIIWFENKPSQEIIDFMKSRANTFLDKNIEMGKKYGVKAGFEITGFRLIEFKVVRTEQEIAI